MKTAMTLRGMTPAEIDEMVGEASVDDIREAILGHVWWHDLNETGRRKVAAHVWLNQIRRETMAREAMQGAPVMRMAAE